VTTVALDGRGVDRGPEVIVAGARAAAGDGVRVRVFGDPDELAELEGVEGVEVIGATGKITNDDDPVAAVRGNPSASIVLAAADVSGGHSDALASAGPTGATMTAALFAFRRLHGLRRPALAVQLAVPGREGPPTVLLDVGANSDYRPNDLLQFAYLGSAFSRAVLGVESPRVALLSVGEEAKKGSSDVVVAHAALVSADRVEFAGNVEGRDLLGDSADVIVTDGFTGNVALKTIEGTAKTMASAIGDAARSNPLSTLGGLLLRPALGGVRHQMDPDTTGGGILLGLRGIAVVGHGSSGPDGIANAVRLAARAFEQRAVDRTAELLERSGATRGAMRDRKQDG
jgi:glycerol-3-phosphate acyltransferase PlsX